MDKQLDGRLGMITTRPFPGMVLRMIQPSDMSALPPFSDFIVTGFDYIDGQVIYLARPHACIRGGKFEMNVEHMSIGLSELIGTERRPSLFRVVLTSRNEPYVCSY